MKEHGKVDEGECAATSAGKMKKVKYVIHTVGPTWDNSVAAQVNVDLLYSAVYNTLKKANELNCQSVSIPAISSGIYGFPKRLCAKVFFQAIKQFVVDSKN